MPFLKRHSLQLIPKMALYLIPAHIQISYLAGSGNSFLYRFLSTAQQLGVVSTLCRWCHILRTDHSGLYMLRAMCIFDSSMV